ncbi:MAG: hypothetical protein RMM17_05340 [Acidobacteriota bacterium]|nr:hypothetical protein [Blastocatellia bacterium]MDW8412088.1 hypothetical protein [Acidobacteriota bacterium]
MEALLFYLCTSIILVAAIFTISSANIERSSTAFASMMLALAGIYLLLNEELLASIQILLYAAILPASFLATPASTSNGKAHPKTSSSKLLLIPILTLLLLAAIKTQPKQVAVSYRSEMVYEDAVAEIQIMLLVLLAAILGTLRLKDHHDSS